MPQIEFHGLIEQDCVVSVWFIGTVHQVSSFLSWKKPPEILESDGSRANQTGVSAPFDAGLGPSRVSKVHQPQFTFVAGHVCVTPSGTNSVYEYVPLFASCQNLCQRCNSDFGHTIGLDFAISCASKTFYRFGPSFGLVCSLADVFHKLVHQTRQFSLKNVSSMTG
jgi:hypothetical protein